MNPTRALKPKKSTTIDVNSVVSKCMVRGEEFKGVEITTNDQLR